MAFVGALIVFSGLVVLSIAISQFKRIIDFWENRINIGKKKESAPSAPSENTKKTIPLPAEWPTDIREAASIYKPLFEKLGSSFELADLYKLSGENNYPHPHLTIKQMREAQIIIPTGDGRFSIIQLL
jgi:hypothetical protein